MNRLAIESLSVFSMPPPDFVRLAAELGCVGVTISMAPFAANPHNYAPWTLRDAATMQATKSALKETGVLISCGEGFVIMPDVDAGVYAADIDAMAELGAPCIASMSIGVEWSRTIDQFGVLAEMARKAGLGMVIEPVPIFTITNLPDAVKAIKEIGQDVKILLDAMHLLRSGGTPGDVAALDPGLIGYFQICDAPKKPSKPDYSDEVMTERLIPGEGEASVAELLAIIPDDIYAGIEIPLLTRAIAGEGPRERLGECVRASRALMAQSN